MDEVYSSDSYSSGASKDGTHVVELRNVTVKFDDDVILDDLSLYIKDKEFVTLLGPSGCGKTTTLRLIAGFLAPDSGEILFDGVDVKNVPAHRRPVNTIFQRYALFPNYNVYDNIAFGLKVARVPKNIIAERVEEMLELVNLKGFEKRPVHKLSGGQQQRVAIARAAINNPKVLLLDEPLAALDAKLRKDMQNELKAMQRRLGITFVFVTHDQEEALSMSDTVVVMDGGRIQQIGSPVDIYNEPKNAFVADFIGESNIIDGVMIRDRLVMFHNRKLECVDEGFEKNEPVDVVIRPEDVDIVHPAKGLVCGTVTSVTFKGVHYEIIIDVDDFKWMVQTTDESKVGDFVGLSIDPDAIHVMKKSEYSGTMGDYSYFSDEMEDISNPDAVIEEAGDEKID